MVRVGGGYVTIAEYYNKYSTKQCVQIFHIMNAHSQTFKEVVVELLTKNSASSSTMSAYENLE